MAAFFRASLGIRTGRPKLLTAMNISASRLDCGTDSGDPVRETLPSSPGFRFPYRNSGCRCNPPNLQRCRSSLPRLSAMTAHIGVIGLLIEIRHTCYLLLKFVSPDFGRKKQSLDPFSFSKNEPRLYVNLSSMCSSVDGKIGLHLLLLSTSNLTHKRSNWACPPVIWTPQTHKFPSKFHQNRTVRQNFGYRKSPENSVFPGFFSIIKL